MFFIIIVIALIFVFAFIAVGSESKDDSKDGQVVNEGKALNFVNRLGIFIGVLGVLLKIIGSIAFDNSFRIFSAINIFGSIMLFACALCFLFSFLRWLFVRLFL
jgi:hypothetical protein